MEPARAQELAAVAAEFVLPSLRKRGTATRDWPSINLGKMFGRIIKQVGLVADDPERGTTCEAHVRRN